MSSAYAATEDSTADTHRPRGVGRAPRGVWLTALAVGVVVAVLAFALMPAGRSGEVDFEGDARLAAKVKEAVGGATEQVQGLSVATVQGGDVRSVTAGTTDGSTPISMDTPFETGSVFKVFTAMTLADLVGNGEAELDQKLGDIFTDLEFADPAVAGVTLEQLASHHSGLPRVPQEGMAGAIAMQSLTLTDPYAPLPPVEESLAAAHLVTPGEYAYSNFGFAVLGAALARLADTPYPELVRERVLDPVGMDDTFILGADTEEIPEDAAYPHIEAGARTEPWHAVSYAPVGVGTWTTTADLTRFLEAVMDGTAPGMAAVEAAHDGPAEETSVGLAWMTTEFGDGVELVQHSGGTYGSSAFIGYQDDHAIVVLSNSFQVGAAMVGPHVMGAPEVPDLSASPMAMSPSIALATTLPLVLLPPLLALALMWRRKTLIGQRRLDRLRIVSMPLGAFAVLLLALRIGSWVHTPPAVWAAAAGLVTAALVAGVWYWPRVPGVQARWKWVRIPFFALSVTVSGILAATMCWALAAANL